LEERKEYYRSPEWVYEVKRSSSEPELLFGIYRCMGGTFRVSAKVDPDRKLLEQVIINGDFFVEPKRLIYDLEAYLKHTPLQDVERRIREFFKDRQWEGLNLTVDDIVSAVMFPLTKIDILAYQKGMIPITITSFELLRDTLKWCAENGYTYVGHCCYEFYEKRYEIFQKASKEGAKGVLFNIVGTTCYSLGVEEEEKAYHGEFTVELDLIKDALVKSLSVREDEKVSERVQRRHFDFSPFFKDFVPSYYKKPKAVPTPEEDRTRTALQKEVFLGDATIDGKPVSYETAFEVLAEWLRKAKKPTVVGPLLLWDWQEEELSQKAEALRELIDRIGKLQVKVLPDYRPKLKKYDPSVEMDPPNPHESILHDQNDLTILVGVHCYRTDFVIRLLRKHTPTKVVALCGLYGHPEAHLSTSFTDAEKLFKFLSLW